MWTIVKKKKIVTFYIVLEFFIFFWIRLTGAFRAFFNGQFLKSFDTIFMRKNKKLHNFFFLFCFPIKIFEKTFLHSHTYREREREREREIINLFQLLLLLIKIKSYRVVCLPLMKVNYYRDDVQLWCSSVFFSFLRHDSFNLRHPSYDDFFFF